MLLPSRPHPAGAILAALALALALSGMRGLSRSILPSIRARMAFHAPRFVPLALARELPPMSKGMIAGSLGAALVSFAALVFVCRRGARARAAPAPET